MARSSAAPRRRSLKIRSGDHVKVISGKDRGKSGRILRVDTKNRRVFVEGLNMVKRHMRPKTVRDTARGQTVGGVIEREGPIHISNVMLLDGKGNPTRVGIEREGPIHISNVMLLDPKGTPTRVGIERQDGNRVRVAKKTGARLE